MKVKKPQAAVFKTAVSVSLRTTLTLAVVAAAILSAPLVSAQAKVVDSSNRLMNNSSGASATVQGYSSPENSSPQVFPAATAQSLPASSQAELFYRVQALQEEVSVLRGMVEEQGHELKRLKQQRLDDYLNLDRRLTELGGKPAATTDTSANADGRSGSRSGASSSNASTAETSANARLGNSTSSGEQSADEMQSYRAAIDLVLRQKDYDQAVIAFNQYLTDYPQGLYAANSEYWLGEICLLQGDLEQARTWFDRLLNNYPDHDKAADAQYKLGTVYHKLGDAQKAKSLLNKVVADNPNTNAARLASNYLSGM